MKVWSAICPETSNAGLSSALVFFVLPTEIQKAENCVGLQRTGYHVVRETALILTLIPATGGGGGKMTPSAVFVENRIVRNGMRQPFFVTLLQTPWVFQPNREYHYIYFRFYEAGWDVRSTWLVLRLPALYACDAKI